MTGDETRGEAGVAAASVAEAIARWEEKGPTSLTVALAMEALYGVREICEQVEANPVGWGGPMAVSLARTLYQARNPVPAVGPTLTADEKAALLESLGWDWSGSPEDGVPHPAEAAAETFAAVERILAARDRARDAEVRRVVEGVLPEVCQISRTPGIVCTDYIGGEFGSGVFVAEMCCLPCRVHQALAEIEEGSP